MIVLHVDKVYTEGMRKRLLLWMLLVVLNLVLLEGFTRLIVVQAKPTLGKTSTYDQKFQIAQQKQVGPEIIVLGDSIIDFGVYPELLEVLLAEKGVKTYARNLASPGASPLMNLLLLKEVVAKSGKPELVVYNFYPRIFNRNASPDEYDVAFKDSYLWRCYGDEQKGAMETLSCVMEDNLALVRYRSFLRSEMEKMPKTMFRFEKRMEADIENSPETEVSPKGWAPSYKIHSAKGFEKEYSQNAEVLEIQARELDNYQWSTKRFDPFLEYCKQQNIPVLLVWLPEHDFMENYYRKQNLTHEKMAEYLKQLTRQGHIYFADLKNVELGDMEYSDLDHPNTLGAIRITRELAKVLQLTVYKDLITGKEPVGKSSTETAGESS